MAGPEYTQSMGQTWYEGSTLSVAIGQESSQFTPLQLANYIATLVNGAPRYSAHLLKEVKSSDFSQVLYTYEPEVLDSIDIQPENLDAVKAGMLALTTGKGSLARYFQDLPVQVGARLAPPRSTPRRNPTLFSSASPPMTIRRSPSPWWWRRAAAAPLWPASRRTSCATTSPPRSRGKRP